MLNKLIANLYMMKFRKTSDSNYDYFFNPCTPLPDCTAKGTRQSAAVRLFLKLVQNKKYIFGNINARILIGFY